MPVARHPSDKNPQPHGVQLQPVRLADVLAASDALTDRDLHLLCLLNQHRVFTTVQVARLLFGSATTARHRLVELYRRGVLARFRREIWPGSQPWRYTLGHVGAAVRAAETGAALPRPAATTERVLRLARSPHTDHLLGVNDFFTTLAAHARRTDGCQLARWQPESVTAEACASIVRPDGYGEWIDGGNRVGFFLEHDTGTETLATVVEKIAKYDELARAGIRQRVLVTFTTSTRETHFHHQLADRWPHGTPIPVATTSIPSEGATQATSAPLAADPVWLCPLDSSTAAGSASLPDATTPACTLPDRHHRTTAQDRDSTGRSRHAHDVDSATPASGQPAPRPRRQCRTPKRIRSRRRDLARRPRDPRDTRDPESRASLVRLDIRLGIRLAGRRDRGVAMNPADNGGTPAGTPDDDAGSPVWSYRQRRSRGGDRTYHGHMRYIEGECGEKLRAELAGIVTELLRWAANREDRGDQSSVHREAA